MAGPVKSNFRQLADRLRKTFPGIRWRARRGVVGNDCLATSHVKGNTFVIIIDKDLDEACACFVLVHEVPHAVSWHIDTIEHGPAFWAAFKKAYRTYEKWCAE